MQASAMAGYTGHSAKALEAQEAATRQAFVDTYKADTLAREPEWQAYITEQEALLRREIRENPSLQQAYLSDINRQYPDSRSMFFKMSPQYQPIERQIKDSAFQRSDKAQLEKALIAAYDQKRSAFLANPLPDIEEAYLQSKSPRYNPLLRDYVLDKGAQQAYAEHCARELAAAPSLPAPQTNPNPSQAEAAHGAGGHPLPPTPSAVTPLARPMTNQGSDLAQDLVASAAVGGLVGGVGAILGFGRNPLRGFLKGAALGAAASGITHLQQAQTQTGTGPIPSLVSVPSLPTVIPMNRENPIPPVAPTQAAQPIPDPPPRDEASLNEPVVYEQTPITPQTGDFVVDGPVSEPLQASHLYALEVFDIDRVPALLFSQTIPIGHTHVERAIQTERRGLFEQGLRLPSGDSNGVIFRAVKGLGIGLQESVVTTGLFVGEESARVQLGEKTQTEQFICRTGTFLGEELARVRLGEQTQTGEFFRTFGRFLGEEAAKLHLGEQTEMGLVLSQTPIEEITRVFAKSSGDILLSSALARGTSLACRSTKEGLTWAYQSTKNRGIIKTVDPGTIRFSQTSVNDLEELIAKMSKGGWNLKKGPIDLVRMEDGRLITLNNTRVLAAHQLGIETKAIIRQYNNPLPSKKITKLLTTTKNGAPSTWGEAVQFRINKQNRKYRTKYSNGSNLIGIGSKK